MLGYSYDEDKVYERIISILETEATLSPLRRMQSCWPVHGSPYETLYSDKLVNIAVCGRDDYATMEEVRQIYDVFEARVRKNGYCGLRMTANVRRKIFSSC